MMCIDKAAMLSYIVLMMAAAYFSSMSLNGMGNMFLVGFILAAVFFIFFTLLGSLDRGRFLRYCILFCAWALAIVVFLPFFKWNGKYCLHTIVLLSIASIFIAARNLTEVEWARA